MQRQVAAVQHLFVLAPNGRDDLSSEGLLSGHVQSSKPGCAGSRTRLLLPTKLPWAEARAPLCAQADPTSPRHRRTARIRSGGIDTAELLSSLLDHKVEGRATRWFGRECEMPPLAAIVLEAMSLHHVMENPA